MGKASFFLTKPGSMARASTKSKLQTKKVSNSMIGKFSARFCTFALIAFCVFAFCPVSLGATFPAPPAPLYSMWQEADLVVFGDVISADSKYNEQRANVNAVQVLKGDAAKAQAIVTVFTRLGGCPYPHSFEANERVLMFLDWDQDALMFTPVSSAEAVIETDADGLKRFREVLTELDSIYKLAAENRTDEKTLNEQLLRWSLKCAISPATRNEGITCVGYLMPEETPIEKWLMPEEAKQLVAVIADESGEQEKIEVMALMREYPSVEIDQALLSSLNKIGFEPENSVARVSLQLLPERLKISMPDDLKKRLDEYWTRESDFYYGDNDYSEEVKAEVKSSLDIEFGWLCANVYHACSPHVKTISH